MLQSRAGLIDKLYGMAVTQINKAAFVDTGGISASAGMPMDPAAAGGAPAPVNPAAAAPPMDPAAAAAAPPMDPAAVMADPASGGASNPDLIRQVIQQELAAAGIGAKAVKPKPVEERVARVEHMLASLLDFFQIPASATQLVDPLGLGPQEQQGAASAAGGGGGGAPAPPKTAAWVLGQITGSNNNIHDQAAATLALVRKGRQGEQ